MAFLSSLMYPFDGWGPTFKGFPRRSAAWGGRGSAIEGILVADSIKAPGAVLSKVLVTMNNVELDNLSSTSKRRVWVDQIVIITAKSDV